MYQLANSEFINNDYLYSYQLADATIIYNSIIIN